MLKVLFNKEPELYFKIRMYELLKTTDMLRLDYLVPYDCLETLIKKHDVLSDPYVVSFTKELEEMLKSSNKGFLGI